MNSGQVFLIIHLPKYKIYMLEVKYILVLEGKMLPAHWASQNYYPTSSCTCPLGEAANTYC